jgi:replicative DNA helicase
MAQPKSIIGLTSGFPTLDFITKGFRPADLILIAGRPAMGKTILMMNIARHMAMSEDKRVLVFSLEMTRERLMGRMVSEITGIPATLVEQGMIDRAQFGQIHELVGKISKSNLIIDDSSNLTISEIRTKTRKIMHEKGLDAVFVDYLQIISPPLNAGRMQPTQVTDEISRGLTTLAKDLKIPVFAVSQLSRANEQRANKRPSLSDLRQSGQLEQDASVVIFVHRPEFYNEFEDERGESTRDKAYLLMAKHRHGGLDDVRVNYVQTCYKFVDESIHTDTSESRPKFAPSERFNDYVDIIEPEKDNEIPF